MGLTGENGLDREKQRIFLAIFSANFISTFGETIPSPFQPLFFAGLGISATTIGLVYNIRNIVQTVIRVPIGTLSDRLGRRRLMLVGLLFLSLVPLIYSVSNDALLPFVAMTISGFGISMYYPPSEAYTSNLFPPERVGQAMGRFHLGWAISAIIGPFVGGLLASSLPSYRPIFQIASLITAASVLVIFLYAKEDSNSKHGDVSDEVGKVLREFPAMILRLLRIRRILVASVAVFVHSFCNWGIPTFFPLFAAGLGFNEVMIGALLTANSLVMGVSLSYMGSLSDRVGRLPPIALGLTLSVTGFALLPMLQCIWVQLILMAVIGLGGALVFPITEATIMEALPENERGMGTGLWGTIMSFGGAMGLFAMSYIASVAPLDWIFYFSAAFTLASVILIVLMRNYFKG